MKPTSQRWLADADQYQKQVDEARSKGLPHDQMLATMGTLRACAKEMVAAEARIAELETALSAAKRKAEFWFSQGQETY
jgi:hypothetical protein